MPQDFFLPYSVEEEKELQGYISQNNRFNSKGCFLVHT